MRSTCSERGWGGNRFINLELTSRRRLSCGPGGTGGARPSRRAFAVLLDTASGMAAEAVADLEAGTVVRWTSLEGQQPAISADEFFAAAGAVKRDPRYREALARRGIEGDAIDLVHIEPWATGMFETGGRLARALSWIRSAADDPNPYARPIGRRRRHRPQLDGSRPRRRPRGAAAAPAGMGLPRRRRRRTATICGRSRSPSRRARASSVEGGEVRWQKWRFRVGFTPARGWCCTRSATRTAAACGRSSTARRSPRWWCPTATPAPTMLLQERLRRRRVRHRHAGQLARAGLRLPRRDPLLRRRPRRRAAASRARSRTRSACTRRTTASSGSTSTCAPSTTEVRRSRRLVVSFIATVGNYEYGFYWYFYQDGTIEFEVKLTGIVSNGRRALPGEPRRTATLVAPRRRRADPPALLQRPAGHEVDGDRTTRSTRSTPWLAPAGPENPHRNAFRAGATLARDRVGGAARRSRPADRAASGRSSTRRARNRVGQPVGLQAGARRERRCRSRSPRRRSRSAPAS